MSQTRTTSLNVFFITMLVICIYWVSGRYHAIHCTGPGFEGLVKTIYRMGSPLCVMSTYVLTKSTELYIFIIIGLVSSVFSSIYNILPFISTCKDKDKDKDK
jgi:hypothetical protein